MSKLHKKSGELWIRLPKHTSTSSENVKYEGAVYMRAYEQVSIFTYAHVQVHVCVRVHMQMHAHTHD